MLDGNLCWAVVGCLFDLALELARNDSGLERDILACVVGKERDVCTRSGAH